MWKPPINFITLHYAWIIFSGLLALVVIYPSGNVPAIDAWFFGASASTESGLNTIDVKDLKTYQQVYIYVIPIITNLGFINTVVVAVRLMWFEKKFRAAAASLSRPGTTRDLEAQETSGGSEDTEERTESDTRPAEPRPSVDKAKTPAPLNQGTHITFDQDVKEPPSHSTLYIPPPRERDEGHAFVEKNTAPTEGGRGDDDDDSDNENDDPDAIKPAGPSNSAGLTRRRAYQREDGPSMSRTRSIEHAAASLFVLGKTGSTGTAPARRRSHSSSRAVDLPYLSRQATVGRNSSFHKLTARDRERLGGIEYRALKLLLKIVSGYFVGLHVFGVVCLLPWIHNAPAKYTDWLAENAQGQTWWAFYSAQTMTNNLGFTLTPDSMITFRDATWPLLSMTFLAYAGETFYPILLRALIWTLSRLLPAQSSTQEPLRFLLAHPRRCCMLLFPSRPTWILLAILVALNALDVLLIIVLDLDNPAVNDLSLGPRVLSALFQAASARHTGTSTFNLAAVNPAVQFSLLIMMYIAIFPIAISIRASNTYEERALGVYEQEEAPDETSGRSYVLVHVRNQLSFDLWYVFLGTFFICVAESERIADVKDPAFSVFSIMFEVVSAYANVGLSLGHPTVMTSLSGQFNTISKVIICAMMIRGRHRGLPYALDRAIVLPGEDQSDGDGAAGARDVGGEERRRSLKSA